MSRIVNHLVADLLAVRRPNPLDGRSTLVLPCDGTAGRPAQFGEGLGAVLTRHRHTLRQLVAILDPGGRSRPTVATITPAQVTAHLAQTGRTFLEDILPWAPEYGLANSRDRSALAIAYHRGTVSPSRLARDLHLTSGGTTLLMERMESNGLVRRRKPEYIRDRRTVEVTCAPRGAEAMTRILRHFADHAPMFARAFAYATMLPDRAVEYEGPGAVTA